MGDSMIAEIHGKISSTGSNLTDKMEDKLTGDFFGNLRYLPYEKGLLLLLGEIQIYKVNEEEVFNKTFNIEDSFIGDKIKFWPYHENAELDVSISLENIYIGIEVKYNSGLSSKDQLERELIAIKNRKKTKKGLLIFIARGDGIGEGIRAIAEMEKGNVELLDSVLFSYITWEDIYEIYNNIKLDHYNEYEKLIVQDILRLLKSKGFERFRNFDLGKKYKIMHDFFYFDYKINFNFNFDIKIEECFYEFG